MLSRILLLSLSMIFLCEAQAQWSSGSQTVGLDLNNFSKGVSIRDATVTSSNTTAKLQVVVIPGGHGGLVTDLQGISMTSSEKILQLGMSNASGNPLFIGAHKDGSNRFQLDSEGEGRFYSGLKLLDLGNTPSPTTNNIALRVRGAEALWYDGTYYSWGHGGSWNRFTRPVTIGSATMPSATMGLRVDDNKGIEVVGGGNVAIDGGNLSLNGGALSLDGGHFELDGGNLSLDGGDLELDGGALKIKKDGINSLFFQTLDGSFTKSSLESGLNFLNIYDHFQVVLLAGADDQFKLSNHEGAFFDSNITLAEGRNLKFGDNVTYPEAFISHEKFLNQSGAGVLKIRNEIEDGNILLSTNGGEIQITNNVGAGVFLKEEKVGINEKNPLHALHIFGNVGITGEFFALSDRRVKKDIDPIAEANNILNSLNPVTYNYKNEAYTGLTLSEDMQYGLIAQEVEEVLPTLITVHSIIEDARGEEVKLKGVNYTSIIPILIKGYQEQQNEIDAYKSTLTEVIKRLESLEQALAEK